MLYAFQRKRIPNNVANIRKKCTKRYLEKLNQYVADGSHEIVTKGSPKDKTIYYDTFEARPSRDVGAFSIILTKEMRIFYNYGVNKL